MTGWVLHEAAGLVIAASRAIPGFPLARASREHDVTYHLQRPAPWAATSAQYVFTSSYLDQHGAPIVRVARTADGVEFDYSDGTRVWLDWRGRTVWCVAPAGTPLSDTATYLTGPIFALLLRLRGGLALHASSVVIHGGALALTGPHGSGKSTTAAALVLRGARLVTDDVLRLSAAPHGWIAHPFADSLRVWPDAAPLLFGSPTELPAITPGWNKRALHVDASGVEPATAPVPLQAIVVLDPPTDAGDADVPLAPLRGAEAVVRLAVNSSAAHLLDEAARAREFADLAALVRSTAVGRAVRPADLRRFPHFINRIEQWAHDAVARGVA